MTEEEISSTGQFTALSAADVAASYSPSASVPGSDARSPSGPRAAVQPPSSAAAKPAKAPTAQEIKGAIASANDNLASANRELDYRVDAVTGISVALIRDTQTGVVLQQIPGANIIALARMLADWSPGKHMLLDLIA
jgi:uncharacterized FlaG/YvyC family protein